VQEQKYPIKHWAKDDRPREKLREKGAETLSDAELLSILIHNGSANRSAVDLGREVLSLARNNLLELGRLSIHDLMRIKGIGEAKAITITAALELGRRRQSGPGQDRIQVTSSRDIAIHLQERLKDYNYEVFGVVYLNGSNRVKHWEVISKGGITGTVADPRLIMKKALEEEAVGLILVHNHPSGNLKPSRADEDLTQKIKSATQFFDIKLLDHLIVSQEGYFSFADEGILWSGMTVIRYYGIAVLETKKIYKLLHNHKLINCEVISRRVSRTRCVESKQAI